MDESSRTELTIKFDDLLSYVNSCEWSHTNRDNPNGMNIVLITGYFLFYLNRIRKNDGYHEYFGGSGVSHIKEKNQSDDHAYYYRLIVMFMHDMKDTPENNPKKAINKLNYAFTMTKQLVSALDICIILFRFMFTYPTDETKYPEARKLSDSMLGCIDGLVAARNSIQDYIDKYIYLMVDRSNQPLLKDVVNFLSNRHNLVPTKDIAEILKKVTGIITSYKRSISESSEIGREMYQLSCLSVVRSSGDTSPRSQQTPHPRDNRISLSPRKLRRLRVLLAEAVRFVRAGRGPLAAEPDLLRGVVTHAVWAARGEVDLEAEEVAQLRGVDHESLGVELGAEVHVHAAAPREGHGAVARLEVGEVVRALLVLRADAQVDAEDDLAPVLGAVVLEVVEAVGVDDDEPPRRVEGELRAALLPPHLQLAGPRRQGDQGQEVVLAAHGGVDGEHVVQVHHGRGLVHEPHLARGLLVVAAPRHKGADDHEAQAAAACRDLQQLARLPHVLEVGVAQEHVRGDAHLVHHGALHLDVQAHVVEDHLVAALRGHRAHEAGDVPQVHALLAVAVEVVGAGQAPLRREGLAVLRHHLLLLQACGEGLEQVHEGVEGDGQELDLLDGDDVGGGLGHVGPGVHGGQGLARVVGLEVQLHQGEGLDDVDVGEEPVRALGLDLLLLELEGLQRGGEAQRAPLLHEHHEVVADLALVLLVPLLLEGPDEQLAEVVPIQMHVAEEPRVAAELPAHQRGLAPARAQRRHHGEEAHHRPDLLARLCRPPHLLRGEELLLAEDGVDGDGDDGGQ
eukprot:741363-Hanusia_phi.AAC.1